MIMAEEFERCEKCSEAQFEQKTFVLVQKNSPLQWGQPNFHKEVVHIICTNCSYVQYKYNTHNY